MGDATTHLPPLSDYTNSPLVSMKVEEEVSTKLTASDIMPAGRFLLVLSIVSIFMNMYILWLVFRNWRTIRQSGFFNTNLLCLILTAADLLFALFVGFPGGLHLSWINYFKGVQSMLFYSRQLGLILFEFLFLLRVMVIAALSADRCIHIFKPTQYSQLVTLRRITGICVTIIITPILVRVIPTLVVLFLNEAKLRCLHFIDGESTPAELLTEKFSVPLTCSVHLGPDLALAGRLGASAFPVVELIVLAIVTAAAWLTIIVSNCAILLVVVKRVRSPANKSSNRKKKVTRDLIKGCLLVATIAATFSLTNFPYVCIWIEDALQRYGVIEEVMTDTVRFYFSLLTFLSVIFHPWLYLLRMKSMRDLMPSFKDSVAMIRRYRTVGSKSSGGQSTSFSIINDRDRQVQNTY